MVAIPCHFWWLLVSLLLGCFGEAASLRTLERREDLKDVPPASASGWTVPLRGSSTCGPTGFCSDSLTPPPSNKPLSYLALAVGIYAFTCDGQGPSEDPMYQSQSTQLYNAAPLVPKIPDEETFHSLVPQLHQFDYMELKNSTLECMGTIGTINDTAIITLFEIATFEAHAYETVLPPEDEISNGRWAHSRSPGKSWDIYRVEMAGGTPPTCGDAAEMVEVRYAAEYWFYHSEGEDLWTDIDDQNSEDAQGASRNTKLMI